MTMKTPYIFSNMSLVIATLLAMSSGNSLADVQPRGASLNYSQKAVSIIGNPAAAALIVERKDPHAMTGGLITLGGGIEYGDIDELFSKIDDLRDEFNPSTNKGVTDDYPLPSDPASDIAWENLFNEYPDLEGRLAQVEDRVASTVALVAVVAAEGYAKAELTSEATFVLNEDFYGGTLMLGASLKGNSQAVGIFDSINFDANQAKEQLKTLPDLNENDPAQVLNLSGGVTLYYNPANQQAKLAVDNDSLLLVRATKISQISLSYSRKLHKFANGELFWGIKPSFYRVGLTNISTRLGDLTDSETLFDTIKDTNFIYENGFDLDLGLVWAAPHYQLGASFNNLLENSYKYPVIDRQHFESKYILQRLDRLEEFTMERQLRLEAGLYTAQRNWSLHMELDANAIEDTMRDKYQWLTVTGGYESDSWWLPSARIGFSRNLTGTEQAYINAGITVMKFINIDFATTIDTVNLDGDELRRGANINIGVQFDY